MKSLFYLLVLTFCSIGIAQEKFILKAAYEIPKNIENFQLNHFLGIEKLKFSLNEDDKKLLEGKDFKLIIKEYHHGKLFNKLTVIDTKKENLPKIDSAFQFSMLTQHIFKYEKIGFFFPRFANKKTFEINQGFNDGDFLLRKINAKTDGLEFEVNNPFQIALITPPNRDPSKGNLGYCEVSQGGIEVESWYEKYKIPQFFLIYMEFE